MILSTGEFVVDPLDEATDRSAFACEIEALDRYFRQQAGQDERRHVARTYVLRHCLSGDVAGFYTLANSAIQLTDLPPSRAQKLPRYPQVPATLLGRLAVDIRYRKRGLGEFLLFDAMHRSLTSSRTTAWFALLVDAKNDASRDFYLRYGFEPIPSVPLRLFLPMQDIERDFSSKFR